MARIMPHFDVAGLRLYVLAALVIDQAYECLHRKAQQTRDPAHSQYRFRVVSSSDKHLRAGIWRSLGEGGQGLRRHLGMNPALRFVGRLRSVMARPDSSGTSALQKEKAG